MPFCSLYTRVPVYRALNTPALRAHTKPTLLCASSARKPQGMKSIPSLAEHWEPVFQVISVCRTKLNSSAAQVGGRAALAPGRSVSCRAPRDPDPKWKPLQQTRAEQVPLPRRPEPQNIRDRSSANSPRPEGQQTGVWEAASWVLGSRGRSFTL